MKFYRATYGLSKAQKKDYYVGWKTHKTKRIKAPSDSQAEFLARFESAPEVFADSKRNGNSERVILVLQHLHEVPKVRKVF